MAILSLPALLALNLHAHATPPDFNGMPTVVDSQNTVLGSTANGASVLRRVGDSVIVFDVAPETAYEGRALLHVASDCSDQPLIASSLGDELYLRAQLDLNPLTGAPEALVQTGIAFTTDASAIEVSDPNCAAGGNLLLASGFCCETTGIPGIRVRLAVPLTLPTFVAPIRVR